MNFHDTPQHSFENDNVVISQIFAEINFKR